MMKIKKLIRISACILVTMIIELNFCQSTSSINNLSDISLDNIFLAAKAAAEEEGGDCCIGGYCDDVSGIKYNTLATAHGLYCCGVTSTTRSWKNL